MPQFADSPVDPKVKASVAAAAEIFADLGHSVDEGKAPFAIEPLAAGMGRDRPGRLGLATGIEARMAGKNHPGPRGNGGQWQSQNAVANILPH